MKKLLKLVLALAALAVLTGNAVASSCQDDINSGVLTITAPTASNITATSASLTGTVSVSPLPSGCTYTANLVFGSPPPPYALLASGTIPPSSPLTLSSTASPLNPSSNYDARIEVTKACLGLASTSCDGRTNYFTTLTGASSSCVPPPSGMALWLTGDNNTNDISGNGNNGTLQGSATYTSVAAGKVSNAFSLSASSDFIEVLNTASLNFTGNFSIDAWIKTTNTGTATIIDKRAGTTSNPVGYHLFLYGGNLGFQLGDGSSFSGNYMFTSQPYSLNDGLWHYVAVTINRTSQTGGKLYIDGVYVYPFDPTTHSGNISNTANLRIGQRFLSAAQSFQGAIDEVELFNRALSQSEIQGIFNAGSAGKCKCIAPPSGMVAWWPLDETSGTTVSDIVGGFNGTAQPGNIGASTGPGPVTSASWPPPNFPVGKVNTSLFFYGNRYVDVPHNTALEPGTGDFTIDAWVIYAAAGNNQELTIVRKGASTGQMYKLVIDDNPSGALLSFGQLGSSMGYSTSAPISPNTWHYVAVTLQRGVNTINQIVNLYIDGTLAITNNAPNVGNIANTANLLIGGDGMSKGEIAVDEVELFNRALSQSEIQGIFNADSSGKCKCIAPPSGMVSWWPFDETGGTVVHDVADSNNGTPKTGPVGSGGPTPGSGMVGGALNFNGSSDFVQVPNAPNLNFGTSNFSIDAWIRIPAPGTGFMPIADKRVAGPTDAVYGYTFYVNNGYLGFSMNNDINATPYASIGADDTTTNVANNNWSLVAVTVQRNPASATGGKLLINGAIVATFSTLPFVSLNADNTGNLIIGSSNRFRMPVSDFFNGWIDEMEIFNQELSQSEIQGIFNAGSAGKCKCVSPPSGMVAWYPLGEPQGAYYVNDIAPQPSSTVNNWGTPWNSVTGSSSVGFGSGPAPVVGEVGGALYFYGAASSGGVAVKVAPQAELDFGQGDFSIDAWVSAVQCFTGLHLSPIVDKLDTTIAGSPTGFSFYLDQTSPGNASLNLQVNNSIFISNNGSIAATANPLNNTGPWFHIAVTVHRPTISGGGTFYINGASAGTFTPPTGSVNNTLPMWIGNMWGPNGQCAIALDEIEIFNRELQQIEIQAIYHAGSAGKCKPKPITAADNCTATLKSRDNNYYLNEPIIKYDSSTTTYYNAEFVYVPTTDNQIWFELTNAGVLTDISPYNSCQPSILSQQDSDWMLYLPNVELNGSFYWVDLEYSQTGGGINFVVTRFGSN